MMSPAVASPNRRSHDERVAEGALTCPLLRYTDAGGESAEFLLTGATARVTVGRAPENDVPLTWDVEVSRLHATFEWIGGAWTVSDDGLSRNGTFVNGVRLTGRRRLRAGDAIRVGGTLLAYREYVPRRDETTQVAADVPSLASLTESQRAVLLALCRPFKHGGAYAVPTTNQQIAAELFLSPDAVKTHLRALFTKFGVEDLPQNQKRLRLVERALQSGVVTERHL
jgi:predicted component of type VI protein secretion system